MLNIIIMMIIFGLPLVLPAEEQAYLLDSGGMYDPQELTLLGSLQGLVNRERPLLYLNHINWQSPGASNVFAEFLTKHKGIRFIVLSGLPEAIATFRNLRRADGTPILRGLVRYEPDPKRPSLPLIAANFAALEDLLPVTDALLSNRTPFLAGQQQWTTTDVNMSGWREMFTSVQSSRLGLRITSFHTDYHSAHLSAYRNRWVELDLDRTPKIEVSVTDVEPGGEWGLAVDLASSIEPSHAGGTMITSHRTDTGVFVFDLGGSGKFKPRSGRANIQLCSMINGKSCTVSKVRLLQADGTEAPPIPPLKPIPWSEGLPVLRDLRDASAFPELATEERACRWSIDQLLPRCSKNEVFFARPICLYTALDRVVARRIFTYYEDLTPYKDPFPNLEVILSRLTPPALVSGGLNNESFFIHKLASYGHSQAVVCENLSFWSHVPADPAIRLPQVRHVAHVEPKVYINFSGASGDVMQQPSGLMSGLWPDSARGSVPITWGMNPLLADMAPAMIEFFARSATPWDSFWAGPSGAGYTAPSAMPEAALKAYAAETRRCIRSAGMSPAVDYWDSAQPLNFKRNYTPLIADVPSGDPPIELFSSCAWRNPANVLNYWTDEGAPVIIPDLSLFGLWENPKSGVDVSSDESQAQGLAQRIISVADQRKVAPLFLTLNIRWRPKILAMVAKLLPADRFQVVGMPDFTALAQEAGRLAVRADANAIVAGGAVDIEVAVRNPTAAPLPPGKVTWHFPSTWGGTTGVWPHPSVPARSVVRHRIRITAPSDISSGSVEIPFELDSVPAVGRSIPLTVFAETRRLLAAGHASDWILEEGATLRSTDEGIVVVPHIIVDDFWKKKAPEKNGQVRFSFGSLDLQREPVLDIDVVDNESHTRIYLDDGQQRVLVADTDIDERIRVDVVAKTGWKGSREVSLVIAPGVFWGKRVTIADLRRHYRRP